MEHTKALNVTNQSLRGEIEEPLRTVKVLKESQERYQEAQRIALLGHWELDLVNNELLWSDEIYRIFDIDPLVFGSSYEAFLAAIHPDDRELVKKAYYESVENRTPYDIVHRLLMKDGTVKHVHEKCETTYSKDGTPLKSIGTVQDITERKQAGEFIRHMAYHDPLTGLPNRLLLLDRLNQVLARGERRKKLAAILFIDLDNFKTVNDTLGHLEGDKILKVVAERIKEHIRNVDTIARQGGDEFTILVQDLKKVEYLTKMIDSIFSVFETPFIHYGQEFFITVSMGISIFPNDGHDAETLLKNADIALYKAKDDGRNTYRFFTSAMTASAIRRFTLSSKLRSAIKKEEFVLHYQPQINSSTGELIGVEALVRWEDPESGLIPPLYFIPLAEDTGLIVPLGEWVLRTACAKNRIWQDKGMKPIITAVNLSMRQFRQKDFVSSVERILQETDLAPKYLELELTESIVMEDVESTIEILHALKAMGLRLSIDDFGTGYSSLGYLKKMPVNMLKIAHEFVRDMTVDVNDVAIARAVIQMAQSLDMEVIAEGVETREHLKLLHSLNCNKIQGYVVSKPLPPEEVEVFLNKEWRFAVEGMDLKEQMGNIISM